MTTLAIVAVLLLGAACAPSDAEPGEPDLPPYRGILVVADTDTPMPLPGFSTGEIGEAGMRVAVDGLDDVEDAARDAKAIVVSYSSDPIDEEWVREHYRRGVVVVAVNVPGDELGEIVGDRSGAMAPHPEFDDTFYSIATWSRCPDGQSTSLYSGALVSLEEIVGVVEFEVNRMQCS